MIQVFRDDYFSFLMEGKVEQFQAACESLNAALAYGATLADAQRGMDDARRDAELLCVIFDNVPVHGSG